MEPARTKRGSRDGRPRPATARPKHWREGRHATLATALLVLTCGVALAVGSFVALTKEPPPGKPAPNLESGAIVFIPASGNRCAQRTIDNATWQIRESGTVDCDAVLSGSSSAGGGAESRVDRVREGFRRR